jgi:hypothetical protein
MRDGTPMLPLHVTRQPARRRDYALPTPFSAALLASPLRLFAISLSHFIFFGSQPPAISWPAE